MIAALMTFLLYGVFPLTIVLYLMGTPQRKRNRQQAAKSASLLPQQKALPVTSEVNQPPASPEK
ncbi:hypothetical protein CAter282_2634 [Collimonas arenae]|uniref:Transmembrane protein n=1 Tax=Collimonas arenae TaxID=279058 RepID=A0A127QJY7_9BURK|nr:hypothetical protein CAter282_2634 [Collimonas arenae]